jgi:hypothetical protein
MAFHPRSCLASRTKPRVSGIRESGGSEEREALTNVPGDQNWHLFIDSCDVTPVNGNSGSLIAVADDFSEKLGVYHWSVTPNPEALRAFPFFEYAGNSAPVRIPSPPPRGDLYGVGTDFEPVLRAHPGIF